MGWLKSMLCSIKWFFGVDEDEDVSKMQLKASPFVTSKPSPMFYDEDGFLAHEFYEEVVPRKGHALMKRITKHLRWEGMVPLEIPRLHFDFPVALYQD